MARTGRVLLAAALALVVAVLDVPVAAATPDGRPGSAAPTPAACAAATLAGMSLSQRVGQLLMLGIGGVLEDGERAAIRDDHIGSVTFSALVTAGRSFVRAQTAAVRALATSAATHRVGFLIAANQEGGAVQALSGTGFSRIPSAVRQGRMDPATHRDLAAGWARELRRAGVNIDLAPVGDVVPKAWESINQPIGRLDREFGRGAAVVSTHVTSFIAGMDEGRVLTAVKHFPGLGRVTGNTDFAAGVTDRLTTPDDAFLRPFRRAVEGGVAFVMVSLAVYTRIDPGTIAAFSQPIITGILRTDLGFRGVVISDDLSAVAVRSIAPGARAIRWLMAGGDLIVVTGLADSHAMAAALLARARARPAFRERVDAAALRVLQAKGRLGLLPCG